MKDPKQLKVVLLDNSISGESTEKDRIDRKTRKLKIARESPVASICNDVRRAQLPRFKSATIVEYEFARPNGIIHVVDALPGSEKVSQH